MHVSGYETQKEHIKEHKIGTYGSWWYIEVLWSEMIGLCKKLNIIYNIITWNPEPQANWEMGFFSANWIFWRVCFNELVQKTDSP